MSLVLPEPSFLVKDGRLTATGGGGSYSIAIAEVLRGALGQSLREVIGGRARSNRLKSIAAPQVKCAWSQGLHQVEGIDAAIEH